MSTDSLHFIFCHCEVNHKTTVLINSCILLGTFHLEVDHYGDPHIGSETVGSKLKQRSKANHHKNVIHINNENEVAKKWRVDSW